MFFLCGGVDKAYVWGLSALRWPHIAHLSPLGQMQVAIRQALELDHQEGCGIVADRGPWSVGSIVLIGLHIQILPCPGTPGWACPSASSLDGPRKVVPVRCYGHLNIYIHFTNIPHDTNNVKTSTIMVKYLIQQTKKRKENVSLVKSHLRKIIKSWLLPSLYC
jgi:hypothetical protein